MEKINIVLFGIGGLGSKFIKQTLLLEHQLKKRYGIEVEIQMIANSSTLFLKKKRTSNNWEAFTKKNTFSYELSDVIEIALQKQMENLVVVDATSSAEFKMQYSFFLKNDILIIEPHEIIPPLGFNFYTELPTRLYEGKSERFLAAYG